MKFPSLLLAAALGASLLAAPASAVTREETTISSAMVVLRELQAMPDLQVPDWLLARAEGLVVLPGSVKFGFLVGLRIGSGVMLVRRPDGSWSNPVFVNIGGGSFGWQVGGQVADVVLVFTTPRSVEGITDGKLTLGADASVAAGPVGRTAIASTSVTFDSEVYAYSRSKGLFAGISLEGSGIFISHRSNRRFYDEPRLTTTELLASRTRPPAPAGELVDEVRRLTTEAGSRLAEGAAAPAEAAAAPAPASESARPAEARTYPMPDPEPGQEPR